jgi:hypothetical protein
MVKWGRKPVTATYDLHMKPMKRLKLKHMTHMKLKLKPLKHLKHMKHMMEECRGASPKSLDATQTPDLRAWRTSLIVCMPKKEESITPFNVITRRKGCETPSFSGSRKW